jgi:hypothetical protein
MYRRLCLTLVSCALASAALGQELGARSYGLRGGLNMNPDQFSFGGHLDAGRLGSRVRLQPSADFGIGNGLYLASANFDAHYLFSAGRFRPYAGGGVGVNFIDVTNGIGASAGLDIEPVLNLVGGIEWGSGRRRSRALGRYLLEARVGLGDTPELKVMAGFNF